MFVLSCFSWVQLFATPWIVTHQAPLSMGFPRQEYRSGLPCPPPRDLPHPGIEPASLMSPALTGRFFTSSPTWEVPLLLLVILILAMVSLVSHLVMNSPAMQETRFDSWVRKIHWRREWLPTAVSWPGEFHGLYSTWGRKKLDTTEQLSLSLYLCSLFIFYIAVHTS